VPERAYVGTELEIFARATRWKAYLVAALREHVRGDVAEVGAGLGAFTTLFLSTPVCTPVRSWSCIEPDASLLAALRARHAAEIARGRIRCVAGTLDDLAPSARFDCILYIDVLEHIEDDRAELARAAEHLAPCGKLVVLAPAHELLFSAFDRAIGHHRRYDSHSLSAAAPSGLRREQLRYLDSVGMLASLANRLLLEQSQPTAAQVQLWDRCMVPLSRRLDPLLRFQLGKSILGVWSRS
jgi:2-polyprenyl-3-methyl-5-hydroxy-6-metoxy-1,4-benzoquinol methylase